MSGDLDSAICETQWGSGEHRILCGLAVALQKYHGNHLDAWMDTAQLVLRGRSPRDVLSFEDSRSWQLLRRSLTAEADRLRNEEIKAWLDAADRKPVERQPTGTPNEE